MGDNLDGNSGNFAGQDEENKKAGETSLSPLPDTRNVDAKHDDDNEPPAANTEGESKDEKKEEKPVEVPESSPSGLEKVSHDIDQLLVTLQRNAELQESSLEIPDFIDKFLDLVEEKVARYDTGETKAKWGEVAEEDSSFLEAVDRISKLMESLSQSQSPSEEINQRKDKLVNRIAVMQQRAMSYLEEEFSQLLMEESRTQTESDPGGHDPKGKHVEQDRCTLPDSELTESDSNFPGYPEGAIASLNKIAKCMISGGYQSECCQVYIISRRYAIEESLRKLEFEKISIDEIQKMNWESLERDIPAWIKTFKACASIYFSGERKLVESVFREHPSIAASLSSNLTRGVVIQLLNFAEGVAMLKRSTEKLFKILDMYETLRDIIPALDDLFPEECVNELKTETTSAKCRLGEAAICIFCDLENSIKSDTRKDTVPGGGVHPLTRYILNYLRLACEYRDTLEQVFREHSKIERADSTSRPNHEGENSRARNDSESQSPFKVQLMRVMELLDSNLEGKAKQYKDVALSCIFKMNNGRYILQKIKGSGIYQLMDDTWCRRRSADLRTYHQNYKRTWTKLLGCLNHEGLSVNGKVHKPVLKERFKSFNAMFDEIHKAQSTWVVSDEQLKSELRVSISGVVIPAYRSFVGRFAQIFDPGRQTEKYIKYQADDLENYIDELFEGNAQSMGKRKS